MSDASSSSSPPVHEHLQDLIRKISSGQQEQERAGAKELRRMTKSSPVNRLCIAELGAIPRLISLLASEDGETQLHAITTLLNLTLKNERNKEEILLTGGVDNIVHVLNQGSVMEGRENAAATVFSLSSRKSFKLFIGLSDVFTGLVHLLQHATARGKKDAAAALYSLTSIRQNRALAVRGGAVPPLLHLVEDPASGLVNESLTVLCNIAAHREGRFAIDSASGVRIILDLIKNGADQSKEYAVAVLSILCQRDAAQLRSAWQLGGYGVLKELSQHGSVKARSKASELLELMNY